MFLFEFTVTACLFYHIYDKCISKRTRIKRSKRTLTCRTHNNYIVIDKATDQDIEDAKTLQFFFNKLKVNKQIKEISSMKPKSQKLSTDDEMITKKMYNKKKSINKKLTKKVKQLEKENKELQTIIRNLKCIQNKEINNSIQEYHEKKVEKSYIIPNKREYFDYDSDSDACSCLDVEV